MNDDRKGQHSNNEIVRGKRSITADTAPRLAKVFETSVQFWMGLQDEYELREARNAIEDQRLLVVCEVGGAPRALERAYPPLPFVWQEISDAGSVFVVECEALPLFEKIDR